MTIDGITYMVKPSWVSWQQLQELQKKAHCVNQQNGIDVMCSHLSDNQSEKAMGGVVAMEGIKLVASNTFQIRSYRKFLSKGRGIFKRLMQAGETLMEDIDSYDYMWLNTAERNENAQRAFEANGFRKIMLSPTGYGATYYSVIMLKDMKGNQLHPFVRKCVYWASKILIKIIWKPGKIIRFQFWK